MRKMFLGLATAVLSSAAFAVPYTLDGFDGSLFNSDLSTNGSAACDNDGTRQLCSNLIESTVPVTQSAIIGGGVLEIANGGGERSVVDVSWVLPVAGSNLQLGSSMTSLTLNAMLLEYNTRFDVLLNGVGIGGLNANAGTVGNIDIAFNSPFVSAQGQRITLRISSAATSWDLTVDSVGINGDPVAVPAPSLALLLGLGLVAVGFRRK